MEFKRYNSIENSYRQKFIDKFEDCQVDVLNIKYVAREKLDGANLQLFISPNSPMKVGKRSSFIKEDEGFFDVWNVLKNYQGEIQALHTYANLMKVSLRVFGELYGPGINGRVDYGPNKAIAIFDIYQKDLLNQDSIELLLTQKELETLSKTIGVEHLLCPLFGYYDNLDAAMAIDVEVDSKVLNKVGNFTEGVIIQPYDSVLRMWNGERMILKKKSKLFEDKHVDDINAGQKAEQKEKDIVYMMNKEFKKYITKNRLVDCFAKYGEIQEPKQIPDYIKYMLEDAKIDFLKDHNIDEIIPNMDKKQQKDLYNVGNIVVSMLKEHL